MRGIVGIDRYGVVTRKVYASRNGEVSVPLRGIVGIDHRVYPQTYTTLIAEVSVPLRGIVGIDQRFEAALKEESELVSVPLRGIVGIDHLHKVFWALEGSEEHTVSVPLRGIVGIDLQFLQFPRFCGG